MGHGKEADLIEEAQQPRLLIGECARAAIRIPHLNGASKELIAPGALHAVDAQVRAPEADDIGRRPGAGGIVFRRHQPVTRIQGNRHRSAQIDIAQAHHQVARIENDPSYLVHGGKSVDAPNELDVIRTPGRVGTHRGGVARDRFRHGRIGKGQGQPDDPRGNFEALELAQSILCVGEDTQHTGKRKHTGVVVDLQGADTGRDVDDAGEVHPFELEHQCVHSQTQGEVEHVGPIFNEYVPVPLPSIDGAWTRAALLERGQ